MQGGKLHFAPLEKDIERILDVGTGTGIWAIDFADEFPNTAVLGTDLSPIQPSLVPPNCRFEVDDCEDDWIYPENYFDYIHIRTLFGSIKDWKTLYARAYK
jgi:ubiquinone/menaquinone biosynthesis C-methylase UbiE